MSLRTIVDSIVADADLHIAEAKQAHDRQMQAMQRDSETALHKKIGQLRDHVGQKKRQLAEKAEARVRMTRNKAVMLKKGMYMDMVYADVLTRLVALPERECSALLERCLRNIGTEGTVHPSKNHAKILKEILPRHCTLGAPIDAAGGFILRTDTKEFDCTFESFVSSVLRPTTEVQIAARLFSSSQR